MRVVILATLQTPDTSCVFLFALLFFRLVFFRLPVYYNTA